ncbi:MAG: penicillin-binding protein activator LpoB, partial [Planctomycetota bacterium]
TMKSLNLLPALLLPALVACGGTTVRYEDPAKVETLSSDFGSTDLLMIAQKMTQSFTNSNVWGADKPRIVFGGVKNRTRQHLDTQNITDPSARP